MINLTRKLLRGARLFNKTCVNNGLFKPFSKEDKEEEDIKDNRSFIRKDIPHNKEKLKEIVRFEKETPRNIKAQMHRDNFLFEKFLSNDEIVPIYNVTNIVYPLRTYKDVSIMLVNQLLWLPFYINEMAWVFPAHLLSTAHLLRQHLRFVSNFVEKVDFDPKNRKFLFRQRKAFTGGFIDYEVPIDSILWTGDQELNKLMINFINMDNLETYSIIYIKGWINKDLFSYLIRQNIQTQTLKENRDLY